MDFFFACTCSQHNRHRLLLCAAFFPNLLGDCPGIKPADPKDQGRSSQPGGERGNRADQQTLPQHTGASPPAEGVPRVRGPRLRGPGPLKLFAGRKDSEPHP